MWCLKGFPGHLLSVTPFVPRVAAGVSSGGQFTHRQRRESSVTLGEATQAPSSFAAGPAAPIRVAGRTFEVRRLRHPLTGAGPEFQIQGPGGLWKLTQTRLSGLWSITDLRGSGALRTDQPTGRPAGDAPILAVVRERDGLRGCDELESRARMMLAVRDDRAAHRAAERMETWDITGHGHLSRELALMLAHDTDATCDAGSVDADADALEDAADYDPAAHSDPRTPDFAAKFAALAASPR